MPAVVFVAYAVVEIAAFAVAVHLLGAMPAILLLLACSAVGVLMLGGQWRRVVEQFGRAGRGEISPGAAVADGALVASGGILLFVPGLVTSVAGLLMLFPPTRILLRPVVAAVAARWVARIASTVPRRAGVVDIDGVVVGEWYDDPRPVGRPAIER
ncbi:FxsA family protein [Nocardia paucivorans]|uniref:FxsA family protein n=1 Tax=Nocardia paucivorans TaxID=114259 RepID=UPI0002DD4E07|nr:FxsA family protein [Nocardia paucivorans]